MTGDRQITDRHRLMHQHQRLTQQRARERHGDQEQLRGVTRREVAGQRVHQRQPDREQQRRGQIRVK